MLRLHLHHIDDLSAMIVELDTKVDELMTPLDISDLVDEHRGEHSADAVDLLDRLIARQATQPEVDVAIEERDLTVIRGDEIA